MIVIEEYNGEEEGAQDKRKLLQEAKALAVALTVELCGDQVDDLQREVKRLNRIGGVDEGEEEKYCLITLEGIGEREIKVVDRDTFKWITSGATTMPDHIVQKVRNMNEYDDDDVDEMTVMEWSGSTLENDKALAAPWVHKFYDTQEYAEWFKKNNVRIVDEIHGSIY